MDQAEAVTAYLDSLPPTARQRVEQIRSAIHSVADGLGEKIAYGILTCTLDGRTVCHTGGYAAHVAVYPVPDASGDHALAERMEPYIAGKGTLKFRTARSCRSTSSRTSPWPTSPSNLSWRRDLNSQPTHYKCVALPIAPLQQCP